MNSYAKFHSICGSHLSYHRKAIEKLAIKYITHMHTESYSCLAVALMHVDGDVLSLSLSISGQQSDVAGALSAADGGAVRRPAAAEAPADRLPAADRHHRRTLLAAVPPAAHRRRQSGGHPVREGLPDQAARGRPLSGHGVHGGRDDPSSLRHRLVSE